MSEITYNIRDASLDDGTINYYTLVDEPFSAETETLRAKIQALYTDAQANRDHRNLNKRREYQTLLEWLPRARTVLLEPEKRARYDAYLNSVQGGNAEVDFDEFLRDLLGQGEQMDEKTGLLGVQDRVQEPRAHVIKSVAEGGAKKPGVPTAPTAPRQPAKRSSGSNAALMGAIGGFIVGAAVGHLLIHSWIIGIVIGVVLAVVVFGALNRQPSGGIRS